MNFRCVVALGGTFISLSCRQFETGMNALGGLLGLVCLIDDRIPVAIDIALTECCPSGTANYNVCGPGDQALTSERHHCPLGPRAVHFQVRRRLPARHPPLASDRVTPSRSPLCPPPSLAVCPADDDLPSNRFGSSSMATCYSTAADCAAAGFDFSTDPERDPFASAASGVGVCVHRGTAVALGEADCNRMDSGFRRNMLCGETRLMFGLSPVSQARTLLPKQPNSVPFEHTIGLR